MWVMGSYQPGGNWSWVANTYQTILRQGNWDWATWYADLVCEPNRGIRHSRQRHATAHSKLTLPNKHACVLRHQHVAMGRSFDRDDLHTPSQVAV